MVTFASRVIAFNRNLHLNAELPPNIRVMNPFKENASALFASENFYRKYFNDNNKRKIILGINPGRFGGGITGVPFTDTKRLNQICNIKIDGIESHEPSSVFVYKMIEAYGGAKKFYSRYYINSICPLGFVFVNGNSKEINYNYYDDKNLYAAVRQFIIKSIHQQISLGIDASVCYCLGTGKNYFYLKELNDEQKFFDKIVPLEHPRYIVQYKSKSMDSYIEKFLQELK